MSSKHAKNQRRGRERTIERVTTEPRIVESRNDGTEESDTDLRQLALQVHLAEYDALYREHDLHHKMRQELGIYTLAATAALVGAFVGQVTLLTGPNFLRFFIILPFFFTLMTWWYIRTNYSAALIEMYVLTELRPKLNQLTGTQVLGWIPYLYKKELSASGRVILGLQTVSRVCLIQGPALISLLFFGFHIQWDIDQISLIDGLLIIVNLLCILLSLMLMFITWGVIIKMRKIFEVEND